jgi:large conductance mechanosensitive channel
MPIIGVILGGVDFTALSVTVGSAVIQYGLFIQAIVNFVIIGFVLFLVVRSINRLQRRMEKEQAAAPPAPSAEEILLTEIRDLLKQR